MSEQRDLRWNFGAALIDSAGWNLGMGLVSYATILPLFVGQLTHSGIAVGMIQAVMFFGWLVPGILVSGRVERLARVKISVVSIAMLERFMLLLMVPLCLWLGQSNRTALLIAFFVCWSVMNFAVGANVPGYYKLIAKTIPAQVRGRLYGIGGAIGGVLGAVASVLAGWLLADGGFPYGYALCFLGAFVIQTVSVLPLGFMREEVQTPEAAPEHIGVWRALRLVRDDPRLLWVSAAVALFSLNQMAGAFYTVYGIDRFHASAAVVAGQFTGVLMVAKSVSFLLVGWIGDRHGNRLALQVATVAGIAAAATAWAAPSIGWLYVVFALNELAIQGWGVCSMNYVLELCPPEKSSTYTAVFGVLTGPFRVAFPLLGGVIASVAGYHTVFAPAVLGGILTLFLLLHRLPEPRRAVAAGAGVG